MCVDKETSIGSFIAGTIINILVMLYFKTEIVYIICIWLQCVIFMQFAEYLICIDQKCGETNKIGTRLAMVLNITQPIFIYLALMCFSNVPLKNKIYASIVVLLYICFMLLKLNKETNFTCIKPLDKCSGLNLKWWYSDYKSSIIYILSLIVILSLLLRPESLSIFTSGYILLSLIVSAIFYSCNLASMWCLFAVPFPLFFGIFYKLYISK